MVHPHCASYVLVVAILGLALSPDREAAAQRNDDRKPSLSLKATPPVGFTPLKVRLVVDVRGGADDSVDFYCPTIEWEWGDDLKSESSEDCSPYEAGKSSIRRRYTTEHTYREEGNFTARFRMKQGKRVVASTTVNVQVRAGVRDDGDQ
jgi:hypothetical protein